MPIDLSKTSLDDLVAIHNEVLRNIAVQTKAKLDQGVASVHDSHSSNHSNHSKAADLQAQILELQTQLAQRVRSQP
jgi:hypothetical protein